MEQSHSSEANWFSASQEIPHILGNLKVHYHVHVSLPPIPMSHINPVRAPLPYPSHFLNIHLNFWHRTFTFNSNKSPTRCNYFSVNYPDVCLQLNTFRAFSRPSSGVQWLQWQPLVLPSYRGDSRAVFMVGPARPTTNSHWAPDDGRENARNMLGCKQTPG
jgi:hypothetical protein